MYEVNLLRLWQKPWTAADSEALDRWIIAQRERREMESLPPDLRRKKRNNRTHYVRKTDSPYSYRPSNCLNPECGVRLVGRNDPADPGTRKLGGRGLCTRCYAAWRESRGQTA